MRPTEEYELETPSLTQNDQAEQSTLLTRRDVNTDPPLNAE